MWEIIFSAENFRNLAQTLLFFLFSLTFLDVKNFLKPSMAPLPSFLSKCDKKILMENLDTYSHLSYP